MLIVAGGTRSVSEPVGNVSPRLADRLHIEFGSVVRRFHPSPPKTAITKDFPLDGHQAATGRYVCLFPSPIVLRASGWENDLDAACPRARRKMVKDGKHGAVSQQCASGLINHWPCHISPSSIAFKSGGAVPSPVSIMPSSTAFSLPVVSSGAGLSEVFSVLECSAIDSRERLPRSRLAMGEQD
ncbi:hypothetical protein BKA81DRAFT_234360 [Phyllosticta paracitricarpa]